MRCADRSTHSLTSHPDAPHEAMQRAFSHSSEDESDVDGDSDDDNDVHQTAQRAYISYERKIIIYRIAYIINDDVVVANAQWK